MNNELAQFLLFGSRPAEGEEDRQSRLAYHRHRWYHQHAQHDPNFPDARHALLIIVLISSGTTTSALMAASDPTELP